MYLLRSRVPRAGALPPGGCSSEKGQKCGDAVATDRAHLWFSGPPGSEGPATLWSSCDENIMAWLSLCQPSSLLRELGFCSRLAPDRAWLSCSRLVCIFVVCIMYVLTQMLQVGRSWHTAMQPTPRAELMGRTECRQGGHAFEVTSSGTRRSLPLQGGVGRSKASGGSGGGEATYVLHGDQD